MAMIHWTGNFVFAQGKIFSMSHEDYVDQYAPNSTKRDANARRNCDYDPRRQPWKLEETFKRHNIRHWPNTWMCISREGTIRGGTEENDPDTGERLGMLILCSINTTTTANGSNRCNYSKKNADRYKINWTDATILKVYSYNVKKDKWILLK